MNSENFLRASDKAETLSQAFEQLQLGNTSNATAIVQEMLSGLPYPAEMRLNVYDEAGNLVNNLTINEQDFGTSIIVRKFLVLSLTQNVGGMQAPFMNIDVQSSKPETMMFNVLVMPIQEGAFPQQVINVMPTVFNAYGQSQSWQITGPLPFPEIYFGEPSSPPVMLMYTMEIPQDSVIGTYNMNIHAFGSNYDQNGNDQFNVIRYGIAELEVGTS
jgi:hypothetical protein